MPPRTEPAAPSAVAERMRRHRQRRRHGLRCFMIELRETEIDALIRNGLLAAESLRVHQGRFLLRERSAGRRQVCAERDLRRECMGPEEDM